MSTQVAMPAAAYPARGAGGRRGRDAKYVFIHPAMVYHIVLGLVPLILSLFLGFG